MGRRIATAALICALAIGGATVTAAAQGQSQTTTGPAAVTPAKKGKGHVHEAWPHNKDGKKPHKRLARKLAKQIGPIKLRKPRAASAITATRSDASRASTPTSPGVVATGDATSANRLLLVRSFDIPVDDKLYADLSNYSWTYDNALATLAFVADKDRPQARQLLDQLLALQNKSGSFNFAFDVKTGASSEVVRSGAVAWVGLAAAAFSDKYGEKTYDPMITGALDYLLSQRNSAGLIKGGPDVSWVSTQHNLLTAELLRQMIPLVKGSHSFGSYTASSLTAARTALETAINKDLLNSSLLAASFKEGQNDNRTPIDVQALGAMYLQSRADLRAGLVGNTILQPGFYVPPRSTTAASTKVSGLKPFLDTGSPDLIWSEGTIESQFALTRLGLPGTYVAAAVRSLAETNKANTVGPIGADRTSDNTWGQYRTWATSAAASWLLMLELEDDVDLFG